MTVICICSVSKKLSRKKCLNFLFHFIRILLGHTRQYHTIMSPESAMESAERPNLLGTTLWKDEGAFASPRTVFNR